METSTLIIILAILLVILIPLLLSYIIYPDKEAVKKNEKEKKSLKAVNSVQTKEAPALDPDRKLSFDEIAALFSNQKSSKEQLSSAIEQLIRYHGKIHKKLGDLPHPDFKRYVAVIMALCSHPQADKDIIILLDQKLRALNSRYGIEIDEAINKGIAKRVF